MGAVSKDIRPQPIGPGDNYRPRPLHQPSPQHTIRLRLGRRLDPTIGFFVYCIYPFCRSKEGLSCCFVYYHQILFLGPLILLFWICCIVWISVLASDGAGGLFLWIRGLLLLDSASARHMVLYGSKKA